MGERRTVWVDCLGAVPGGREVDYLTGVLAEDGVEVDDVELHPGRRAVIMFSSDTDRSRFMSRSWGSSLASIPGIIVRGLTDLFWGPEDEAEMTIPLSVYKAILKNRDLSNKLEEHYGSFCVDSWSSGPVLRGPPELIQPAYEFLQHNFSKEFASSPTAKAAPGTGAGGARRGKPKAAPRKYGASDRTKGTAGVLPRSGAKSTSSAPPKYSGPKHYEVLAPKYVVKYILKNYPYELDNVCQKYGIKYETNELGVSSEEIEIIIRPKERDCPTSQLKEGYEKFKQIYAKFYYSTRKKSLCIKSDITEKLRAVKSRYPRVLLTEKPSRSGGHNHLEIVGTENEVNRVYYSLSAPARLPHTQPAFDLLTYPRGADPSGFLSRDLDEVDEFASLRFTEKPSEVQLQEVKMFQLPKQGTKILLYQGNIIKQNVEAIANATDRYLRHEGGVSLVISNAAGPELNRECGEYIRRYGPLRYGEVAVSGGHKLPMKYIFNAAGPHKQYTQRANAVLEDTCYNIFRLADKYKVTSIAVPTISTGLFMMTKEEFAVAFCEAFIAYSSDNKQSGLQTICVVDIDTRSVLDMSDTFESILVPHGATKSVLDTKDLSSVLTQPSKSTPTKPETAERTDEAMDTTSDETSSKTEPDDPTKTPGPGAAAAAAASVDDGELLVSFDSSCKREHRTSVESQFDTCPICWEATDKPVTLPKCGHKFCQGCLDKTFQTQKICPICRDVIEVVDGTQPEGTMDYRIIPHSLPGYPRRDTIVVIYDFPDGIQTDRHPNPGKPYTGTVRYAYLPNNTKGKKVYQLLKKAFDRKLVFSVGTSITTGQENVVIWNEIHHKTRMDGGPHSFGYPDPTYLDRVTDELAAKGIK